MSAWELPVEVEIGGQFFPIRSDFRAVLDALAALSDPDLDQQGQIIACMEIMYPTLTEIPKDTLNEAVQAMMLFINCGEKEDGQSRPPRKLIDWEKDAPLIAPAVDKVLGYSCRRCEYLHWWEFIGAFHSIGRGRFAEVVGIRSKRARGKKLSPAELEFARDNAKLIELPVRESAEERVEKDQLLKLLDG